MAYTDPQASGLNPKRKTLIFVHGRGWKPSLAEFVPLFKEALRAGFERDCDAQQQHLLQQVDIATVYYGDLTNKLLSESGQTVDALLEIADRQNTLAELRQYTKAKQFRRPSYEVLSGRSSIKELIADLGAPVLSTLGLTDLFLSKKMPEVVAYWDRQSSYYQEVSQRMRQVLLPALQRGDDILLITHCLGSIVAYDTLWELCHGMDDSRVVNHKVNTLITLGSPLGDEFVKRKLSGNADKRFPTNLINWMNVAAEDDFTCHDESVANDFRAMLEQRLISRIKDFRIYNLAVRYGRSNPHNATGYLIHPRVTKLVSAWL